MLTALSRNRVPIRLTDERWQHIANRHPEMASIQARVLETVTDPDLLQEGDAGDILAIRWYESTPLTSKFLVTAYRELTAFDGFVVTAYLTRRSSERRTILWKR